MFEGYQRIGVHCGALHKSLLQQVHAWTRTGCFEATRSTKLTCNCITSHRIASINQSINQPLHRQPEPFICLFVCFCFSLYFGSPDGAWTHK